MQPQTGAYSCWSFECAVDRLSFIRFELSELSYAKAKEDKSFLFHGCTQEKNYKFFNGILSATPKLALAKIRFPSYYILSSACIGCILYRKLILSEPGQDENTLLLWVHLTILKNERDEYDFL